MNLNNRIDNFNEIDHIQMSDNKLAEFTSIKEVYETFISFGWTKEKALEKSGMLIFIQQNNLNNELLSKKDK